MQPLRVDRGSRCVFVCGYRYSIILKLVSQAYIHVIYELSNDMMQREIQQEFTEMKVSKNSFFQNIF